MLGNLKTGAFVDFAGSTVVHSIGGCLAGMGLRVTEEELRGLDMDEHGNEAYSGFQIFITGLEDCIRIRTGERGKDAIG